MTELNKPGPNGDGRARRIAAAGAKWADREMTLRAAFCYWGKLPV